MTNLDNLKYVNQPIMKSDAMSLVTGKPVYLDDVAPKDIKFYAVLMPMLSLKISIQL